jgi:hypothetical protein
MPPFRDDDQHRLAEDRIEALRPPPITLRASRVHRHQEHLVAMVRNDGKEQKLARLAPADSSDPEAGGFTVQWLVTPRHHHELVWLKAVKRSLDFLLVTQGEPLPWAYLCHHTTTAANVCAAESGGVHWRLVGSSANGRLSPVCSCWARTRRMPPRCSRFAMGRAMCRCVPRHGRDGAKVRVGPRPSHRRPALLPAILDRAFQGEL